MNSNYNDTQNKVIVNNIIDELKLNPITDIVPKSVIPTIQPVFEVKKKLSTVLGATARTTNGTSTVFTSSSTLDTYITGATYSLIKDVTCDMASGRQGLTATIGGVATTHFIDISALTLTAQNSVISLNFSIPLKIDRNSAVSMASVFTAGACVVSCNVIGYTEEIQSIGSV